MKRLALGLILCVSVCSADFAVKGEALYWKPTTGGFDYAAALLPNTIRSYTVKPDYNWGFRVGGSYETKGCSYFTLSGLYLTAKDTATVRAPSDQFISPFSLGTFSRVTGKLEFDYWNIDLRGGYFFHRTCDLMFNLFAGVRFADVKETHVNDNFRTNGGEFFSSIERLKFYGAGPEVGVAGSYRIWNSFHLRGEFGLQALIGQRETGLVVSTSSTPIPIGFSDATVIIPGIDAKLSLSYLYRWSCFTFGGEVGYDLNYLYNAVNPLFGYVAGLVPIQRRARDVGFAGPFLAVTVGF